MRNTRSIFACGAVLAILLTGARANAGASLAQATPAQKEDAVKHFKTGEQAIKKKQFERGVTEFRASLDAVESPNTRLELARALRENGKLAEAWTEYGKTIDGAAGEARYAKAGEAAGAERAEVERKIALVTVAVEHAPEGATLKVAGNAVPAAAWGKPLAVTPGAIDVVVDAGGTEAARKSVTVAAGEKTSVSLDAKPAVVVATPPPSPPDTKPPVVATNGGASEAQLEKPPAERALASDAEPAPAPSGGATKLRPFAYVAAGVGVAGFATFAIFGSMSHSTFNDLKTACGGGVCPPGHESDISSGKSNQTIANVGLIVGIVGVVAGASLFVISMPSKAQPAASQTALVVGPGWLGVRGTL